MDPKEVQKLNEAIRLANQVRQIQQLQKQQKLMEFFKQNKQWLSAMTPEALEKIRESAAYDKEEWDRIVLELQRI